MLKWLLFLPEKQVTSGVDVPFRRKKRREERGEQRETTTNFCGGLPTLGRAPLLRRRRGEWGNAGVYPALVVVARFNELLAGVVVVVCRCCTEQLLMLFSH
ncbi:hypothetical protein R3W88_016495 [Solanum pinnatisectum]|uniref:Uncharacterized protein n=1 Tax=Solanum pinnatisectum TaxID=50273 RepID=A0AAV9KYP1_9SOLN|nr:hypothetical protein R3W88_016495 [Solanum pinnatisectum]